MNMHRRNKIRTACAGGVGQLTPRNHVHDTAAELRLTTAENRAGRVTDRSQVTGRGRHGTPDQTRPDPGEQTVCAVTGRVCTLHIGPMPCSGRVPAEAGGGTHRGIGGALTLLLLELHRRQHGYASDRPLSQTHTHRHTHTDTHTHTHTPAPVSHGQLSSDTTPGPARRNPSQAGQQNSNRLTINADHDLRYIYIN